MDVLSCLVLSRISKLVVFLVIDVDNWLCLECYREGCEMCVMGVCVCVCDFVCAGCLCV